ncbi:MAG: hypothetical protein NT033_09120 [Candidatus Omnitrophica bacterium]|nr:hypothetical protein [Candidatus Omnitrophota bacterium]
MRILCLLRVLEDPRAIKEIEHYKWIESERLGMDIGEKRATIEWISAFGCHWLMTHKRDKYQAMLEDLCEEEKRAARQAPQELCGVA